MGDELTYTLTVTNVATSTAASVTLVDTLATSTAFQMAMPSQGMCGESGGTVTCNLGVLGPGAMATTTIVVIPAEAGEIVNTAVVTSAETDSNPVNNTAEATTTVAPIAEPQVDLSLTKSASPDPVAVGDELTYTLTVTNLASTAATSVSLVDTLATSTAFQTATPSQGTCGEAGGTVTCSLGSLGPGAVATTTIVVIPAEAGEIVNTANVASAEADSNPVDNTAEATTTVAPIAEPQVDLSLAKSASPEPVTVGNELTYTLTVTNVATTTATSVTLVDTLATSTAFQTATSSQGTCGEAGGTVTCNLGVLGPGRVATTTIVVIPNEAGTVFNTATVSSLSEDTNPADNTATVTTSVDPRTVVVAPVAPDFAVASSTIEVLVQADDVQDLAGPQSTVTYDPALLTLQGVQKGDAFAGTDCSNAANTETPGTLIVALACTNGRTGAPLTLWKLSFDVAGVESDVETEIRTSSVILSDDQVPPNSIPVVGASDTLLVKPGLCGDVTGGGDVNVLDAILILQFAVEIKEPTPLQAVLGDLWRDGKINVLDAIMTLQVAVGLIDVTECGPLPAP